MGKKHLSLTNLLSLTMILIFCVFSPAHGVEVEKGKIPAEHLAPAFKKLPWGVQVWDEQEAIDALSKEEKILWVDTRPESFFKAGTVRGAVLHVYDKKGSAENTLTAAALSESLQRQAIGPDGTVAFFCQGPECHRSYNATYVAVSEWGYKPEKIIWFRAGYPLLLKAIKDDAKTRRKAKKLISDEALNSL